jgi:hypothetical protein
MTLPFHHVNRLHACALRGGCTLGLLKNSERMIAVGACGMNLGEWRNAKTLTRNYDRLQRVMPTVNSAHGTGKAAEWNPVNAGSNPASPTNCHEAKSRPLWALSSVGSWLKTISPAAEQTSQCWTNPTVARVFSRQNFTQGAAPVAGETHTLLPVGSIPTPATNLGGGVERHALKTPCDCGGSAKADAATIRRTCERTHGSDYGNVSPSQNLSQFAASFGAHWPTSLPSFKPDAQGEGLCLHDAAPLPRVRSIVGAFLALEAVILFVAWFAFTRF